jgi:hypothetical protein
MASKTKKKASKKITSKKAAKKGGLGGGPVAHTPIIVTDGSASIEFDEKEYPKVSATTHQSKGLRLIRVVANKKHDNNSLVCRELPAGEKILVKFTCKVGGSSDGKDFTIRGGNLMDGTGSPSFDFDHGVYNESFPQIERGKRMGKENREITRLEIFRVTADGNVRIHECEVVAKKNFQFRMRDRHLPHN